MASRITMMSRVRFEQLATLVLGLLVQPSLSDSDGRALGVRDSDAGFTSHATVHVKRRFGRDSLCPFPASQPTLVRPRRVVGSSEPTPATSWSCNTRSRCGGGMKLLP